ncbi:MAG TPA: hypothetical protein VLG46_11365, partial [Anaerolineae bacterium]|nr:hypothetical protein [Anaerolineae bacterium]
MSHTRLFRFNLILLVAGLIIAPGPPIVAVTPSPRDIARSASTLVPLDNPIYVDADAPGPVHDGLSWTTAYTDLQDALITATFGSEIWVAEGIYMPSDAADPAATFELPSDI